MNPPSIPLGPPTRRGALAGLILPGTMLAFLPISAAAQALGGDFDATNESDIATILQSAVLFLLLILAGGLWGRSLARCIGLANPARASTSGAVCFALFTLAGVLGIGLLEVEIVERSRSPLTIHHSYTVVFTTAFLLLPGLMAAIVAAALGRRERAARVGITAGAASALAFLVLNVLQDLLGRRVGGPNASDTATMITVTLVGMIGSCMAASAVMARMLSPGQESGPRAAH